VTDAEESLRHGSPVARTLYNAARIYAQAAGTSAAKAGRGDRAALDPVRRHQERALELLGQALAQTPDQERHAFLIEVVGSDQALTVLRRLPGFTRLAAQYGLSSP
jgi:hypothetical protein